MNAVEIEEAVSDLAKGKFDSSEFPFQFLLAFGKKNTTIKKLRSGASNKSDVNGVLQRNNIHIATCEEGEVENKLRELKRSDVTNKYKAKFVLATDGKFFTSEAKKFAQGLTDVRLVLIDGVDLAKLMIEHCVGVQVKETIQVARLDQDFFSGDD